MSRTAAGPFLRQGPGRSRRRRSHGSPVRTDPGNSREKPERQMRTDQMDSRMQDLSLKTAVPGAEVRTQISLKRTYPERTIPAGTQNLTGVKIQMSRQ